MFPWLILALSVARPCSSVEGRSGEARLAVAIGGSKQIQGHMRHIATAIDKNVPFPYAEARFEPSKSFKLDSIKDTERRCLYLRQVMSPDTVTDTINIVPNLDQDDEVTGETAAQIDITSSTTKINTARLGWNKEQATEVGTSATAEAETNLLLGSGSVSATVYGSQRWVNGQTGDKTEESQIRHQVTKKRTCPPFHICRVVTWTYTRTLGASCTLLPIFDLSCSMTPGGFPTMILLPGQRVQPYSGNISVALSFDLESITQQFYNVPPAEPPSTGWRWFGGKYALGWPRPQVSGVWMHSRRLSSRYESPCTFTYALRWSDGKPVRAQALISEPLDEPDTPGQVKKASGASKPLPRAVSSTGPGTGHVHVDMIRDDLPAFISVLEKTAFNGFSRHSVRD